MDFDLFKLHVPKEDVGPRSYLKVYGINLFSSIKMMIDDILNINNKKITYLSKRIARKLNIHNDTVLNMLRDRSNGRWVALPVLIELLDEWKLSCDKSENNVADKKLELQNCIEKLGCGSKKKNEVKAAKNLTINLAKVAGAHMADGCLHKEKTSGGYSYKIKIIDAYKNNLEAFSKWVNEIFGINLKIVKSRCNAWEIDARNKIIGRYLEIFFGFPAGKKTYYNLPKIIERSPKEIKRAFVIGLFSFDGCVETDKTVSYGIANEILRNQAANILKDFKLQVKFQNKAGFYHLKTFILDKEGLEKWMCFFEPNTEKWFKLKEMIERFSKTVFSFEELLTSLEKIYNQRAYINLSKIISILQELKGCDKYVLATKSDMSVSNLYRYIHILEKANILIRTKNPTNIDLSNFHPKYTRLILTKKFINKLFKILREKGHLRQELALKLDVCKFSMNNWAQCKHNIPLDKLKKLLKLADLSLKNLDIIGFNRLVFTYNPNIYEWRVPYRP